MRVCSNDDCPNFVRFSKRAEFRDEIATCSDCGGALTLVAEAAPAEAAPTSAGAMQRIFITVGLLLVPAFLARLALPGIDEHVFDEYMQGFGGLLSRIEKTTYSVFALGPHPIESASGIVGLLVLLNPKWRGLLSAGPAARMKLAGPIVTLSIVLAGVQANGIALYLRSMRLGTRHVLDEDTDLRVIIAVLMLGVLAAGVVALLITRYGIGNGFAWFAFAPVVTAIPAFVWKLVNLPEDETPLGALITLALTGAVFIASRRLLRAPAPGANATAFGSAAAVGASLGYGSVLLVLPTTLATFLPFLRPLTGFLRQNALVYHLIQGLAAAALAWVFAGRALPIARHAALQERLGRTTNPAEHAALVREHRRRGLAVIGLVAAAELAQVALRFMAFPLSLLGVVLVTAWLLDLVDEWRFRSRYEASEPIWILHEQFALGPIHEALGRAKIPVLAKSWRYRSLFQFLAPNVEVEILVPAEQDEEARKVVEALLAPETPAPAPAPAPAAA